MWNHLKKKSIKISNYPQPISITFFEFIYILSITIKNLCKEVYKDYYFF